MLFWLSVLLPLFGTVLGAAAVFFIKGRKEKGVSAILNGFAGGVMTASAIFSLLLPAFEEVTRALFGLAGGFLFYFFIEWSAGVLSRRENSPRLSVFAITLHNLPEGMAVGIALCGLYAGTAGMTAEAVLALSLGIAIQNIPEGAIVSLPAGSAGKGKWQAFGIGVLSGMIEPIGALASFLLFELAAVLLPFFLSFAAAAMLAVVVGELSESFQGDTGRFGRVSFACGFFVMTLLDVLLS